MLRQSLFLSFALALSVATAAAAQAPAAQRPDASAAKGAKADPERRVCRTLATTGTRLSKTKVCKTAREWAEEQAQSKSNLDRMQTTRTPDQG